MSKCRGRGDQESEKQEHKTTMKCKNEPEREKMGKNKGGFII